jgi:uncharacterized Fe-S radical SAM superfamily protein PflX
MDQYRPTYLAHRYPEIARTITRREFEEALHATRQASEGFHLL